MARIYNTAEWGAAPPTRMFSARPARGIVLHHTATPNREPIVGVPELEQSFALARSIQGWHMLHNGWEDTGQHFTVSRGGVILEGRHGSLAAAAAGRVVAGAHAGNLEANLRHWGIETEGTYTDLAEPVPLAQWEALVELIDWLQQRGHLPADSVTPHRKWSPTGCPGHLADRIRHLVKRIRLRRTGRIALAAVGLGGLWRLARAFGQRVGSLAVL